MILGHTQVSALQQGKTLLNLCDSFESSPAGSNQIKVLIRERLPWHVNRSRKDASYIPSIQNGEAISLMLNSAVHGPCCGGSFANGVEYDVTFRFVIEFWPLSAFS